MANPGQKPVRSPHPLARKAEPPGTGPGAAKKKKLASTAITLGTMGVLSTLLVGFCAAQDTFAKRTTADCVDLADRQPDGTYRTVDDDLCDDDGHSGGYHGSHGAYGWYYGGTARAGRVGGGTTVRPANARIDTRSGTVLQRGGFGGRTSGGS
ncbi:hypothetical protein Ssi03_51310 [Sphaerisporangium siamense]|uniref:Uncharacterized protein YgiB involved in biofilm formation n=1 Tax=Sphaerisporangium siamense TaxID=795645 RepID=A0A7W7D8T4_9ACTN|nr:hypothetical protein [Sphaerisporangium siamense]MBB4702166.1 uncharacterized protein YgiB involved in biofilm formation [Sphaerisporangium siamense]GII87141.1 hypothetical protein Ssi03_51310 [Sphaerisporangium siamense]